MVRNTPFARDFLMRWAEYYDQRPSGFSSADNGAIQLVESWQTKIQRLKLLEKHQSTSKSHQNILEKLFMV
jgi:hypothetical protein